MSEQNPPYCLEAEPEKHPAQLFRQAISTLLGAAGGTVAANGLAVSAHVAPNMSVNVQGGTPPLGEIWVPGTSIPGVQGLYYCWNNAPVNRAISASSEADPRIDTVVAQVFDQQYAGAENEWEIHVVEGTPAPGATLETLEGAAAVPASSLVLAYVLVPAKATKIEAVDIKNVATVMGIGPGLVDAASIAAGAVGDAAIAVGRALVETGNAYVLLFEFGTFKAGKHIAWVNTKPRPVLASIDVALHSEAGFGVQATVTVGGVVISKPFASEHSGDVTVNVFALVNIGEEVKVECTIGGGGTTVGVTAVERVL